MSSRPNSPMDVIAMVHMDGTDESENDGGPSPHRLESPDWQPGMMAPATPPDYPAVAAAEKDARSSRRGQVKASAEVNTTQQYAQHPPQEPSAQDAQEPSAQYAQEPSALDAPEPSAQGAREPLAQGAREPLAQGAREPLAQGAREPLALVAQGARVPLALVVQGARGPLALDAPEPSAQGAREPLAQGAQEPLAQVAQGAREPLAQGAREPLAQGAQEPLAQVAQGAREPLALVAQGAREPLAQGAQEPSAQDAQEPSALDAQEPSAQDGSEQSPPDAQGQSPQGAQKQLPPKPKRSPRRAQVQGIEEQQDRGAPAEIEILADIDPSQSLRARRQTSERRQRLSREARPTTCGSLLLRLYSVLIEDSLNPADVVYSDGSKAPGQFTFGSLLAFAILGIVIGWALLLGWVFVILGRGVAHCCWCLWNWVCNLFK